MSSGLLADLRIVEIGEGMATQVAGLLLAELGADVLKVERPGGDPSRGGATFANWNRGKRSLALDLDDPTGLAALRARLAGADALIHQFTPQRAAALGLDDETLAAAFPGLVVCGITGWPRRHPNVERHDDELLVAARLGVFYEYDGYRAGPIVWRYRMGGWATAHLAAAGVLARLVMRLRSGRGGPAHTSMLQGLLSKMAMVWGRNSEGPMPNRDVYPLGPRPNDTMMYECADGRWIQIMDPSRQFDYASLPNMWPLLAEGLKIDTAEGLKAAFRRLSSEVWLKDLRAADVAVEPVLRIGEALRHPEVAANGYVVAVEDPHLGATLQPNTPFHANVDLPLGRPAPRLGEGADVDWSPRTAGDGPAPAHPLAGVKVLDLGMFLAGPMAPSMMGDMGAEVIKVEPITGDRIRFMHRYYQVAARSKRSLAVDLARPEGREVLARLVRWADVVHHNMRFKGADKLGLSEEALRAVDPDIVFSYVSAYGQKGERANWPGYDSIFNAIAGWEFENAGEGNPPLFVRPGTMDTLAAESCLVGTMAGLYASKAGRPGATIHSSLLGVAILSQSEVLIGPDGALTPTARLDSAQTGTGPYQRVFEAADGWIAVVARTEAQQEAMRAVLGCGEADFPSAVRARPAGELLAALERARVPCEPVVFEDAMNRFFDDPRNRVLGLVSALPQPLYGLVEQPGEFWDFGDTPMDVTRCCPALGEHSDEILRQMGYADGEIAALREAKVVG